MCSAVLTVEKFLERLCLNARYGVQGEKPIAVIAALKFLNERNVVMPLSKLFTTHKQSVGKIFSDLAKRYSGIKNPSSSFNIILTPHKELMKMLEENPEVDEAFSELTIKDVKQLYGEYMAKLEREVSEKPPEKIPKAPVIKEEKRGKEIREEEVEVIGEFYLLIRDLELNIREFITEKLGKEWLKRLENETPDIVNKWKKRQNEDYKAGIDPEENLINYADMADYTQIIKKCKSAFSQSEEEINDVIVKLRNLAKYGRNPLMHFRTLTQEAYAASKLFAKSLERWIEAKRKNFTRNQNLIN